MDFVEELQEALLIRLKTNLDAESINLENKLKADPNSITLKELRQIFYHAGIKSITIENTTIKIQAMKEQVEALLDKLKNHEDVNTFSFYEDKEQIFWDFYYQATGWYKDVYFMIGMNKHLNSEDDFEIVSHVTNNAEDLKTFLQTLTNLKFRIK